MKTEEKSDFFSRFAFVPPEGVPTTSLRRSPRKCAPSRKRLTSVDEELELPILSKSTSIKKLEQNVESPPKKKVKRGYQGPEAYAHLNVLQDYLEDELDVVFCGINPGQKSAEVGHHFGNPTNHFWACLHESGFTPRRLLPQEDHTLPGYSLGLTNLVDRPTAEQNELSRAEQIAAVPIFMTKVARHHPRIVCFVGLGIAGIVKSYVLNASKSSRNSKMPKDTSLFLQPYKLVYPEGSAAVKETLFFAVSSTSGRVVQYQKSDKINQFKKLKNLVVEIKLSTFDTTAIEAMSFNYDNLGKQCI